MALSNRKTIHHQPGAQQGSARIWILLGLAGVLLVLGVVMMITLGGVETTAGDQDDEDQQLEDERRAEGSSGRAPGPAYSRTNQRRVVRRVQPKPRMLESADRKRELVGELRKGGKTEEEIEDDQYKGPMFPVVVQGPKKMPKDMHPDIYFSMRKLYPKFANCYRKSAMGSSGVGGKLTVSFNLAPKEHDLGASKTTIKGSSFNDAALHSCITRRMKSFKVPLSLPRDKPYEFSLDLSASTNQADNTGAMPKDWHPPPPPVPEDETPATDPPPPPPGEQPQPEGQPHPPGHETTEDHPDDPPR